ncbi:MAG: hypothetical protein ACREHD_02100, partial [Pirellulales bacterium]
FNASPAHSEKSVATRMFWKWQDDVFMTWLQRSFNVFSPVDHKAVHVPKANAAFISSSYGRYADFKAHERALPRAVSG